MAWQPFDFNPDGGLAIQRLRQVPLVPFADYYQGDYLNSLDQFLHKVFLFLPLGALLAPTDPAGGRRLGLMRALLGAAVVASVLEAGQLFLPSRYASLTDVLVETAGAGLGYLAICRLRVAQRLQNLTEGRRCEYGF